MVGWRVQTAIDPTPPSLSVPADIVRSNDPGTAGATIGDALLGTATATDNVIGGLVVTRTGVPAGNVFRLGVTEIVWTATDAFGNATIKKQLITVNDTEKPTLTAPPSLSFEITSGSSLYVSDGQLGTASAADNSGGVTLSRSGVPAGNSFPIGTTTITYTATDAAGNSSVATQTVTVTRYQPTVSVAASDASGAEQGAGTIVFTVTRTGSTAGTLAVAVGWGGNAASGSDYTVSVAGGALSPNGQTLTFAAGSASATITVTPIDDTLVENTETVYLFVWSGSGYTVGSWVAGASIVDNDAPRISVGNATTIEADSGTTTVNVTVTLSSASTTTITVVATTVADTATAGGDFQSKSATLTFAAGTTTATFAVAIVGDTTREPTETFKVVLSSPSGGGAVIGTGTGTVTITDNDTALTAAAAPTGDTNVAALTTGQLTAAVGQARALWSTVRPGADLRRVSFSIAELDDLLLAQTWEDSITIDATAAGWGWSASGMDLLTVVLHELGHALGLDHEDDGLMAPRLAAGESWGLDSMLIVRAPRQSWIRSLSRPNRATLAPPRLVRSGTLLHRR
jgi:hypothetical protein